MRCPIVSSQYDVSVFVVMMHVYLYLSDLDEHCIYTIRDKISNQLSSIYCKIGIICIIVIIVISNI